MLITTHVCHPSLANDNASGIVLLTELGAALEDVVSPPILSIACSSFRGRSDRFRGLRGMKDGLEAYCSGHSLSRASATRGALNAISGAAAEMRASTVQAPTYVGPEGRRSGAGLRSVGLGRAPVQLAGLRPSGRMCHPLARGRVPRVPLFRRRPRSSSAPRGWKSR